MTEKMTVHEALAELKVLDARIQKKISDTTFVVSNKHNNTRISGATIQEFSLATQAEYNSIRTLINRRNAIKRAVTRSNAIQTVQIAGNEYTIAEAIEMKNHGLENLNSLKYQLEIQLAKAQREANKENSTLSSRVEQYISSICPGTDKKNLSEEIVKLQAEFIVNQTTELVDPLKVASKIEELNKQIDTYMAKVDSALSVSNALTEIEVEYESC